MPTFVLIWTMYQQLCIRVRYVVMSFDYGVLVRRAMFYHSQEIAIHVKQKFNHNSNGSDELDKLNLFDETCHVHGQRWLTLGQIRK